MLTDRVRRLRDAGLLLAAFVVLYLLSNRTVAGQSLENSLARQYDVTGTPGYLLDATRVVPPFHFDVVTLVAGVLLAAVIAAARGRWRELALVVIAAPMSLVVGAAFKSLTGRPRLVDSLDFDAAYPSGHAGIALTVTAALLVALPARHLRWAAPLLVGWSLLVIGGLQAEGQHRASEVLGSALLTAAVFSLVGAVTAAPGSLRRGPRLRRIPWPPAAAAVAVAVAGAWNPVWWQIVTYALAALLGTALVARTAVSLRDEGSVDAQPTRRPHTAIPQDQKVHCAPR